MLRSTFRHSNLKFLLCIFACTICVSHSPLSDPCRVFTFTGTSMIKIPQTNICFHFAASECVALGKTPRPQLLYIICSSPSNGHGTWPISSHGEGGSTPSAAPVPHRAAKSWPSHPRLWYERTQPGSTPHLLHLAYDVTTRTALKPVLDGALKSSKIWKCGVGGR